MNGPTLTADQRKELLRKSGLTERDVTLASAIHDATLTDFASALTEALRPVFDRIKAVEAKAIELEATAFKDGGVWQADKTYGPGTWVTDHGSAWLAKIESKGIRPGDGIAWRLVVKRGANGKDFRR